ncbi:MAG: phosphatidylserine decarboxylase, partial [Pseudomonadota bacterium]
MSDRLFVALQQVLPQRALTEMMGALARSQGGAATTAAIRWFVRRYGVDMSEAANPDIATYASFNDFFTRALREDARPMAV